MGPNRLLLMKVIKKNKNNGKKKYYQVNIKDVFNLMEQWNSEKYFAANLHELKTNSDMICFLNSRMFCEKLLHLFRPLREQFFKSLKRQDTSHMHFPFLRSAVENININNL